MKMISILLWTSMVWICVCLTGCRAGSTFSGAFNGSKVTDENGFRMDYSALNQEEEAVLTFTTGDALQVEISNERGTVDVTIGADGAKPIYEGKALDNFSFVLKVSEAGDYRISVIGHNACGHTAFMKISSEVEGDSYDGIDQSAAYEVYQFALQQIAFEHVYPDGTDTEFDGASGFIEDNHFALCDVNNDGRDELIVQFVTAPMAGNMETIYSYNEQGGRLERIQAVFPAVTYYTNGLMRELWSHGSGMSGDDYWPYNLYRYNVQIDEYELVAAVDMWSKSAGAVDYNGNPYPEDVDVEQAGIVFILIQNGVTETIGKSEYEMWLSELMDGADEIQIPYQSLNEENIKKLSR